MMRPQEEFNPQAALEQALLDHAYAEEWKNRLLALAIGGSLGFLLSLATTILEKILSLDLFIFQPLS